ncbi:unnamed protein product, partial [Porites lobata]
LSPSTVELLNEAAVLPAVIDDSVGIISSSELDIDPSSQPLGSGTFATCFPALKRATLKCAVKVYKYMDYDQFDRELVAMLRCNRHKNAGVVELWWICTPPPGTTGLPRLVMPLVEGVTLGEWVSRYSRRSKPTTLRVVLQLVEAVQHLHDTVNIVHGDLSWKNVVINVARNYHLTLIDFGNARDAAKGKRRLWVHGNCFFSPPEAFLCRRPCDQTTAELHVLGVLLICIARGRTQGLCEAPLTFEDGRDRGEKSAISCLKGASIKTEMKVVHGAPPSYRDEMDKLNVRKSVRRDLDRGFSVAIDSRWDDSLNALVFTVVTPYGEKSQMTLTNTDVPRRISNMCPVVQDPTLLTRDPSTPSELLGQFFLDPTRVAEHVRKRGIKPYDYVNKAIHDIESLPGGYVGAQSSGECLSKFDCMQRTATAVFSYDIATPKFGADGASAAIITGDAAEVWNFFGLAKMPLQDSLLEVFCSAIGVKPDDSLEKRINSPMKRVAEVPLFQVTDTKKQGLDFTSITNLVVLTMNSIPCILNDTFLRQINTVLSSVYPLKEEPIVPGSIFHAVSEKHRDGLGQDQVTTLGSMVTHDHFNNTMRLARESKGRVESCVSYHRHLACLVCGQDLTSNASLLQEVTDPKMIHCGVAVHNAGKFVTTQTKATRRSYSLDCVRRVKILGKDWPQFDKGQGRFGILTKDETKCIFERPCVISECLRPMVLPDIGNQRSKYDNVSSTVYVLVPFDRQATLERLKEEGVQDPQAS